MTRWAKFRPKEIARRIQAIRFRTVQELHPEPADYWKRVCPRCGADVVSYCCKPEHRGGAGCEVLRCENGHLLHPGQWKTVPN